jgi:2-polyprenyl-6-methoxyphenol hydroxylase-like FAD-dependent oxidoreductase
MSTDIQPKILIIGGGVGGLTLAQGLLKNNIPFQVFERDESQSFRAQGYRIRLNGDAVHALKEVLPQHTWQRLEASAATERETSGITKLDALSGEEVKMGPPGGPPGGPHGSKGIATQHVDERPIAVDRTVMREVLLSNLGECISFGKVFERYELHDSSITAHFKDGTSYEGCFLVGADGVNSRVRKQYLPQLSIVDTTGRCIYGKTILTPSLSSSIHPKSQSGMVLIQQHHPDGTPLTLFLESMRFSSPDLVPIVNSETGNKESIKDYIYWVLLSQEHIFKHCTSDVVGLSPTQAAELSNELTKDWHQIVRPIITQQTKDSASALRIVTALPDMPTWKPSSLVTVLGDAAHPMPPTAGLGAVSALKDVESLLAAIREGLSEGSIGTYEETMRKWASEAVKGSRGGGVKLFGQVEFSQAKPVEF